VVSNFAQLDTAKALIVSNQAAVRAAEIVLQGVREEAKSRPLARQKSMVSGTQQWLSARSRISVLGQLARM
jgi:hypothetical protein